MDKEFSMENKKHSSASVNIFTPDYLLDILDSIEVPVMVLDENGLIVYCNNEFGRKFGLLPNEIIGKSIWGFVPPEVAALRKQKLKECIETGSKVIFEDFVEGESWRHTLQALPGRRSVITVLDITARNIRNRQNIELEKLVERRTEELRRTRDFLQCVIDAIPNPLAVKDREHRWILINKIISEMFQTPTEKLIGKTDHDLIRQEEADIFRAIEEEVFTTGKPNINEEKVTEVGGGERWHVAKKSLFKDRDGNKFLLAIATDITDRRNAEIELKQHREHLEELVTKRTNELLKIQEQLIQSQKMEAVGQIAGGISHDFNNILAVILGTAEQIVKDLPETDPSRKHLERITRVANRAKDLTMNLLTFARKDKLDFRTIPIHDLIQELIDLLKRSISKKIAIRMKCDENAPLLSVDVNQMLQSLLNVCINAADAMTDGGTLTIECELASLGRDECEKLTGITPGSYCRILIADTGIGMTENVKEQIFLPFFTTKERGKGTGLGLSITLGIVQSHGGAIVVDSELGKGTAVKIYLPVSADTMAEQKTTDIKEQRAAVKGTILIVDDDRDYLDMMAEILEKHGLKIIPAIGPTMALELYRKYQTEFDLVMLDMMMPEMSGEDVFRVIRKINPDAKILLCSGYSRDGKAGQILAEGAIGFLQKPFDSEQLLSFLSNAICGC